MSDHDVLVANTKFRTHKLTLELAGKQILKDLSVSIPQAKITALIGPSGSGKSSLIRCFNRLWEPPEGSIFLDDRDITTLDVLTLRRKVGMVMQSAVLFEGSIADNVRYGPALRGETLTDARVSELLTMVSLEPDMAPQAADALSGGQAQRVSLARTLANGSEVLLLDEPTSALDPMASRVIEESLMRLRDALGLTIVLVSHSLEQVKRIADYVVLLLEGEVAEQGTAEHLLSGVHAHLTEDFAAGKLMSLKGQSDD